ncbi:MAG: radical SAM protein [Desulfobacterales bacterium]
MTFTPAYIETYRKGLFREKVTTATEAMDDCRLCPRQCRVNRNACETGICKTGKHAWVSSYHPHFGEEAPLVGTNGSGTIFFTHCNLLCNFCQNYDISHLGCGEKTSSAQLADMMIHLQNQGCHNINFVTPSHVVPQILAATEIAVDKGLAVPLVYNSSAYDSVDTLRLLEGVVDIYMPDFKFWSASVADKTCRAPDYPEAAKNALREMHRQVADLSIDTNGIARRGLLVRHLVLPGGLAGTRDIMRFIARDISPNTYVNIMPQYRPCGTAHHTPELSRRLTGEAFHQALKAADEEGIRRLDSRRRVFAFE